MPVEFKPRGGEPARSAEQVEVWHDAAIIASLYPGDPDEGPAIKIISKFLDGHVRDERRHPLPPEITVLFDLGKT